MQEQSFAESASEAEPQPPIEALDAQELEVARLEALLATRTRAFRQLNQEFERRSRLLREALLRLSTAASGEISSLREAQQAAIARAIEAELAKAELTFSLDETRAQLQSGPQSAPVRELSSLYARVAQLEEADAAARARLVLVEQERDAASRQLHSLEARLSDEGERGNLDQAREQAHDAAATTLIDSLRGERSGLLARVDESENAFRNANQRATHAERRQEELEHKLEEHRAESAELAVRAQARAAQIDELGRGLAASQQETRNLRAQLAVAALAQTDQRSLVEEELQQLRSRARELEQRLERERETMQRQLVLATRDPVRWQNQLREFLSSLELPLVELEATLDQLAAGHAQSEMRRAASDDLNDETTEPGTHFEALNAPGLAEKLRQRELRIVELEAELAGRKGGAGSQEQLNALKGELIDTRADATRLADDVAKERARRRRLVVTVRALQAASDSGEATRPWIEELLTILNEGASLPPSSNH